MSGNNFTTINVPGAQDTEAQGLNNNGQIVGDYNDSKQGIAARIAGQRKTFQNPMSASRFACRAASFNSPSLLGALWRSWDIPTLIRFTWYATASSG